MRTKVTIGSRGSQLAIVQSEAVAARLRQANPGLEVNITRIVTTGDRDRHSQLGQFGVAVFVKELEEALLDRRIDLAVHSLKDMPTDIPTGLCLLAVMAREDPRDVLVAKAGLSDLPARARIGTGSLRRSVQLTLCRPDLQVCPIRGNEGTRLHKVSSGEVDGVIVAAAAMSRLAWEGRVTEYLPLDRFLPAVGQGALVIEGRLDDEEVANTVAPLNHLPTWQCVTAERAFLRALGGGCRAPIAALGRVEGDTLNLEGMAASVVSQRMLRTSESGSAESAESVGERLAQRLLAMGASEFIAEVRGQ